jgi:hypothetical protein
MEKEREKRKKTYTFFASMARHTGLRPALDAMCNHLGEAALCPTPGAFVVGGVCVRVPLCGLPV